MSIKNNQKEFEKALEKGNKEFPPPKMGYKYNPKDCVHDFSFCIYCDGCDWDIVRCYKCGETKVTRCTFDDDYS